MSCGLCAGYCIVAVCVVFVAIGAHRGFIRSAAHFLGAVVAACLAACLGGAAAQWVFDTLFRPALVERIGESLASLGSGDTLTAVQQVFASLPDFHPPRPGAGGSYRCQRHEPWRARPARPPI